MLFKPCDISDQRFCYGRHHISWRYSQNQDSSLNTKCCQWPLHQIIYPRVYVFFAVGASSQVVLPNNQCSKVDNSPADLSQEHWWNRSSRQGAEMEVSFGYYGMSSCGFLGTTRSWPRSRYTCLPITLQDFKGQTLLKGRGLSLIEPNKRALINWLIAITECLTGPACLVKYFNTSPAVLTLDRVSTKVTYFRPPWKLNIMSWSPS